MIMVDLSDSWPAGRSARARVSGRRGDKAHALFLRSVVESAPGRPTVASAERFRELKAELEALEARLQQALEDQLQTFEEAVDAASLSAVVVPEDA